MLGATTEILGLTSSLFWGYLSLQKSFKEMIRRIVPRVSDDNIIFEKVTDITKNRHLEGSGRSLASIGGIEIEYTIMYIAEEVSQSLHGGGNISATFVQPAYLLAGAAASLDQEFKATAKENGVISSIIDAITIPKTQKLPTVLRSTQFTSTSRAPSRDPTLSPSQAPTTHSPTPLPDSILAGISASIIISFALVLICGYFCYTRYKISISKQMKKSDEDREKERMRKKRMEKDNVVLEFDQIYASEEKYNDDDEFSVKCLSISSPQAPGSPKRISFSSKQYPITAFRSQPLKDERYKLANKQLHFNATNRSIPRNVSAEPSVIVSETEPSVTRRHSLLASDVMFARIGNGKDARESELAQELIPADTPYNNKRYLRALERENRAQRSSFELKYGSDHRMPQEKGNATNRPIGEIRQMIDAPLRSPFLDIRPKPEERSKASSSFSRNLHSVTVIGGRKMQPDNVTISVKRRAAPSYVQSSLAATSIPPLRISETDMRVSDKDLSLWNISKSSMDSLIAHHAAASKSALSTPASVVRTPVSTPIRVGIPLVPNPPETRPSSAILPYGPRSKSSAAPQIKATQGSMQRTEPPSSPMPLLELNSLVRVSRNLDDHLIRIIVSTPGDASHAHDTGRSTSVSASKGRRTRK